MIMASFLLQALFISTIYNIVGQTLDCPKNSNCGPCSGGSICTLNCIGIDACKGGYSLTCQSGVACILNCDGQDSCTDSTLYSNGATSVSVVCIDGNACSGDAVINCQTNAPCDISCDIGNCDSLDINLNNASDFSCDGGGCSPSAPMPYAAPTSMPTTAIPSTNPMITLQPTQSPTTMMPTTNPSQYPSNNPSKHPTTNPSNNPSTIPTANPFASTSTSTDNPISSSTDNDPTFSQPTKYPTNNPTQTVMVNTTDLNSKTTAPSTNEDGKVNDDIITTSEAVEVGSDGTEENNINISMILIIGATAGCFVFLICITICVLYKYRKKDESDKDVHRVVSLSNRIDHMHGSGNIESIERTNDGQGIKAEEHNDSDNEEMYTNKHGDTATPIITTEGNHNINDMDSNMDDNDSTDEMFMTAESIQETTSTTNKPTENDTQMMSLNVEGN